MPPPCLEPAPAASPRTPAGLPRTASAAAAMLMAVAGWVGRAEALSGTTHSTSGHGLNMTVETQWVDGGAYRPVRITFVPTTPNPTVAERTLTVEFLGRRGWSDSYDIRAARDIDIPAGTSSPVSFTLTVPQHSSWNAYAINVVEDGTLLRWLRVGWTPLNSNWNEWGDCFPAVLFVGNQLPNTSQIGSLLPLMQFYQSQGGLSSGARSGQLPNAASSTLAELPERWIDYSSLDILCLSLDEIARLRQKYPRKLQAIRDWTASGGNLWVYGMGQRWERIGRLEVLLGLSSAEELSGAPANRGWREPDEKDFGRPVYQGVLSESGAVNQVYYRGYGIVERTVEASIPSPDLPAGEPPERPHFLLRPYNMGMVVALASPDPFPGTRAEWAWVLRSLGSDRWLWYLRHGLSMSRANADYWKFLIEGVGLAPVNAFCVMITLFVVAIGPVNYWLLRRWKRLHLLVVSIPMAAAAVTLLLFAYALLADGLGTRVRVRSVTCIDQRLGEAACWARLSYYAGLAPGRGLSFPDDVVVLPFEEIPLNFNPQVGREREVIWEGDQWLASGWLASRTPTQYFTVRARRTKRGLTVTRADGQTGQLRVENRLGTEIRQLLVRADDGNYYWAEDVALGQSAPLKPLTPQDATALERGYRHHLPKLPRGVDDRNRGMIFGVPRRRWGYYRGTPIAKPTQRTGRLEKTLASLAVHTGRSTSVLEPGSYAAVVEDSPEVKLGSPSAREEVSYHAIFGRW